MGRTWLFSVSFFFSNSSFLSQSTMMWMQMLIVVLMMKKSSHMSISCVQTSVRKEYEKYSCIFSMTMCMIIMNELWRQIHMEFFENLGVRCLGQVPSEDGHHGREHQ